MAPEFTPEEPEQERDERAAGKKQLDGEIRAETAEIFHTASFGAPRSGPISAAFGAVTSETAYPGGWKVHAIARNSSEANEPAPRPRDLLSAGADAPGGGRAARDPAARLARHLAAGAGRAARQLPRGALPLSEAQGAAASGPRRALAPHRARHRRARRRGRGQVPDRGRVARLVALHARAQDRQSGTPAGEHRRFPRERHGTCPVGRGQAASSSPAGAIQLRPGRLARRAG